MLFIVVWLHSHYFHCVHNLRYHWDIYVSFIVSHTQTHTFLMDSYIFYESLEVRWEKHALGVTKKTPPKYLSLRLASPLYIICSRYIHTCMYLHAYKHTSMCVSVYLHAYLHLWTHTFQKQKKWEHKCYMYKYVKDSTYWLLVDHVVHILVLIPHIFWFPF